MTLVAVVLKTTDLSELAQELDQRIGTSPDLFSHDPVVVDISQVADAPGAIDFKALAKLLRGYKMLPVAIRGGTDAQKAAALKVGLADVTDAGNNRPERKAEPVVLEVIKEVIREVHVEVPVEVPVQVQVPGAAPNTMVITRPLRSGQQIYAKGGDLIVLAAVNFGAEVIADGNIHVYAPLRGKAIAGAKGNTEARIFSTCMEPELLSIAGTYRTTENPLPKEVLGKPAQIRLDGERLVYEAIAL